MDTFPTHKNTSVKQVDICDIHIFLRFHIYTARVFPRNPALSFDFYWGKAGEPVPHPNHLHLVQGLKMTLMRTTSESGRFPCLDNKKRVAVHKSKWLSPMVTFEYTYSLRFGRFG